MVNKRQFKINQSELKTQILQTIKYVEIDKKKVIILISVCKIDLSAIKSCLITNNKNINRW